MTEEQIITILAEQWMKSGVAQGDILLVHSSIKKLLQKIQTDHSYTATPNTIFLSLQAAIGSSGTLMLPLFNFDFPNTKEFDIRSTPSQMGALTEIGRLHPKAVRTGHPFYSFAVIGAHADAFRHVDNYSGYGPDSPFGLLKALDGKIAIIGLTDQNSMTSYHYVEEQNQVDYRYYKEFEGSYTDFSGECKPRAYALYVRDIEKGVLTDVNRMMDRLWEKNLYKGEKPDEGYGMRTIRFQDFYKETDEVIKSGQAINYLYSIKKD